MEWIHHTCKVKKKGCSVILIYLTKGLCRTFLNNIFINLNSIQLNKLIVVYVLHIIFGIYLFDDPKTSKDPNI